MKKVIQCMCVDFCENIRSQDMYVKCSKIQSTYFVNRDIYCIYMQGVSRSPKYVTYFNIFHVFQNTIWISLL